MVLDLRKIRLNSDIEDNALWVVEQIPGLVKSADVSEILRTGTVTVSKNMEDSNSFKLSHLYYDPDLFFVCLHVTLIWQSSSQSSGIFFHSPPKLIEIFFYIDVDSLDQTMCCMYSSFVF